MTGTARYASLNTHIGIEQSRRDDLECLGFVLLYFLMGGLPWQGVKAKTRTEKYEIIKNMKLKIPIEELVKIKIDGSNTANAARQAHQYMNQQAQKEAGSLHSSHGDKDSNSNRSPGKKGASSSAVPEEFIQFMKYCRELKFEEKPDYTYLRRMFKDLFNQMGYEQDYVYDWTPLLRKQDNQMRKRATAIMGASAHQQQMNMGYPQYATQNNAQAGRAGFEGAQNENAQRRRDFSNPAMNKMASARAAMPSPRDAQAVRNQYYQQHQMMPPAQMHNHHQGDFAGSSQQPQHPSFATAQHNMMEQHDYAQQMIQPGPTANDGQYQQPGYSGMLSPQNGGQQQMVPQMMPAQIATLGSRAGSARNPSGRGQVSGNWP